MLGVSRLAGDEFAIRRWRWPTLLLRVLRSRPHDSVAAATAGVAAIAILINALFLQKGPHPAPIFAVDPPVAASQLDPIAALLARQTTADAGNGKAEVPRSPSNVVADIQRELSRRDFYDGAIDGIYGRKTDAAIRDFEEAARLLPSAEPNDALLTMIQRSNVRAKPASAKRDDPTENLRVPDTRLVALQRALADFGYGPVKATGVHDAQTKAAIERFERARREPVTGQITERLVRNLAALTGRPLE